MSVANQGAGAGATTTTTDPGAPAAGGAPGVTASSAASPASWTEGLSTELQGYVENKGWKNPTDLLDSYRGYEKLMGVPENQILRLPKEDDQEGWKQVYGRLGRPEKADGYKLDVPEGGSKDFAEWAKGVFHEAGLSSKQASGVVAKWNEFVKKSSDSQLQNYTQAAEAEVASLKKEWGLAHNQNIELAKGALKEFGIEEKTLDALEQAMGYSKAMKFLHAIGSKLGESPFVSGNGVSAAGVLSPAGARAKIEALKTDQEFTKRFLSGDASAQSEMERLHKQAYPEYAG